MEKSNDASFYFEELPLELQEHILVCCDDETLSTSMPLVSQIINKLTIDKSSVWRAKCRDFYTESDWEIIDDLKKLEETWKQFYLRSKVRLFPIAGVILGKTNYHDIKDLPGVEEASYYGMEYKSVAMTFLNNILREMTLNYPKSPIPEHWAQYGITWDMTIEQYEKLFTRWNATCLRDGSNLTIVKKEYDQFYQISIVFNHASPSPSQIRIRRQLFSRGAFNIAGKPRQ